MHGWGDTLAYQDIPPLAHYCTNKTVYLCGSFTNGEIARLSASPLAKSAKRLVVPSQHLSGKSSLPREYPLKDREHTNKLLADSDLVVVILPRYGMDASWQIGYATALGKPVVGILRRDDKRAVVNQSFWDHWMHSWKTKTHLTSIRDLGDFLSAYRPE